MAGEQGGWVVEQYTTKSGASPFTAFFNELTGRNREEAIALLDGIIKKTDDIPKDDLKRVRQYKREVEGVS